MADSSRWKAGKSQPAHGNLRRVATIFDGPAFRTRLAFDTALSNLGVHQIPLQVRIGEREPISDLSFLGTATASHKILVLGRISDFAGRSRPTYEQAARGAIASTDAVIFVGDRASALWPGPDAYPRTPDGASQGQMFAFATVREAATFLHEYLTPGDLVLLKGSGPADHLERVLLNREQPVTCWLNDCGRLHPCDVCELIRDP
jgi:hypothetical protein